MGVFGGGRVARRAPAEHLGRWWGEGGGREVGEDRDRREEGGVRINISVFGGGGAGRGICAYPERREE